MTIIIRNLRNTQPTEPWHIRVDRKSVLGNPFHMSSEADRSLVCAQYETWFRQELKCKTSDVRAEFIKLLEVYRTYGKLELYCWCAPKQCHAETIKRAVEYVTNKTNAGGN